MTTEPKPSASPVCYLDEADDHYAGFATADEIRQTIRRWLAQAPSPAVTQALTSMLSLMAPSAPAGDATLISGVDTVSDQLSANDLRAEMRQFLPRIRDDALHAALRHIVAAI